jgi:1-acyl-sn-glycerol-3-phosphate acyltransferase
VDDPSWVRKGVDLGVTLLLWFYFTVGFLVLFAPLYLVLYLLPARRMRAYQRMNHYFYKSFFWLCRRLIPRQGWQVDRTVPAIRSSVIVCNHISYIDPILLISLFGRHTTFVKSRLFMVPIFGKVLRISGYIPSAADPDLTEMMIERMDTLCRHLHQGSNLIVFPEGTRSRNGRIGKFNSGAFKIARRCRLPIQVLFIRNSQRLFAPGRFLFNTQGGDAISVESIASITPDYDAAEFSIHQLMDQVRELMKAQTIQGVNPGKEAP